jgi:hypothetical protein
MVPVATLPPTTPFTDHVSGLVVTDGVNCCVEPARTSAVVGEIVNVPGPGGVPGVREQLESIIATAMTIVAAKDERRTVPSLVTSVFECPSKPYKSDKVPHLL